MKFFPQLIPEVVLIEPTIFSDNRGYFMEMWQQKKFAHAGIDVNLVQDNLSYSNSRVLRGLHYQLKYPQAKLVSFDPKTDAMSFDYFFQEAAGHIRVHGISGDHPSYILDPADVHGPDFPGETFRVLKEKETAKFGEYRTRRLVLEAWDTLPPP